MKLTFEGRVTEVREKLTHTMESEIRFHVGKDQTCDIRIPELLAFQQPVTITLEIADVKEAVTP